MAGFDPIDQGVGEADRDVDFCAFRHPVLAVACPVCKAPSGRWCKRPSGHRAHELHRDRGRHADRVFIARHGEAASIERTPDGWKIDPEGRIDPQ